MKSQYVLRSALLAVKPHADVPFNRDNPGSMIRLAEGSVIQVIGNSTIDGLVDVNCEGTRYAVFAADLERTG